MLHKPSCVNRPAIWGLSRDVQKFLPLTKLQLSGNGFKTALSFTLP